MSVQHKRDKRRNRTGDLVCQISREKNFSMMKTTAIVEYPTLRGWGEGHGGGNEGEKGNDLESLHGGLNIIQLTEL